MKEKGKLIGSPQTTTKRLVTHEMARQAYFKLHNHVYNGGKVPLLSIPRRDEDVDCILCDYIEQNEWAELREAESFTSNTAREESAKIADQWADSGSCVHHDNNPCCHVRTARAIAFAIRQKINSERQVMPIAAEIRPTKTVTVTGGSPSGERESELMEVSQHPVPTPLSKIADEIQNACGDHHSLSSEYYGILAILEKHFGEHPVPAQHVKEANAARDEWEKYYKHPEPAKGGTE